MKGEYMKDTALELNKKITDYFQAYTDLLREDTKISPIGSNLAFDVVHVAASIFRHADENDKRSVNSGPIPSISGCRLTTGIGKNHEISIKLILRV